MLPSVWRYSQWNMSHRIAHELLEGPYMIDLLMTHLRV
jgi:hypothetical protein